jgi:DNA-directed RNA polymerase specialized sigma24 family protein
MDDMEWARDKLSKYYQIVTLIQPEGAIKAAMINAIVVGSNALAPSMPERWAWKTIALEGRILDVQAALGMLVPEYRRWLELRYGEELSVKETIRTMGFKDMPLSTAHTHDEKILREFVKCLPAKSGSLPC